MKNTDIHRSDCPMNIGVELFGDKWSLLIIRDIMLIGKRSFGEFLKSREKIASNILTDRLNRLEEIGILTKKQDSNHKQRIIYSLTEKGISLLPMLVELGIWSTDHNTVGDFFIPYTKKLKEGGKELQKKLIANLRKEHLGIESDLADELFVPFFSQE